MTFPTQGLSRTQGTSQDMLRVAIFAFDEIIAFDLAAACEIFDRFAPRGVKAYEVRVCCIGAEVDAKFFALRGSHQITDVNDCEIVVMPGVRDPLSPFPNLILDALRSSAERGARILALSSGVFVLRAAGLLETSSPLSEWMASKEQGEDGISSEKLLIQDGQLFACAGGASILDLCLRVIKLDYSPEAESYKEVFTLAPLDPKQRSLASSGRVASERYDLGPFLTWLRENLHRNLEQSSMAREAGLSVATMNRRFKAQCGTSPVEWLANERVRKAQQLLRDGALSIEEVASTVGFDSVRSFTRPFVRIVGLTPNAYRRLVDVRS